MKINVNEACAFAKTLENYRASLNLYLTRNEYLYETKEIHKKSSIDNTLEDETIVVEPNKKYDLSVEELLKVTMFLIEEKSKLSKLIEVCKSSLVVNFEGTEMTVDAAIEYNRGTRALIDSLNIALSAKNSINKTEHYIYKADVEGKQARHFYPMEIERTVTYEKKELKELQRTLKNKADKISVEIDKAKINSELDYETELELSDTLDDIIVKVIGEKVETEVSE